MQSLKSTEILFCISWMKNQFKRESGFSVFKLCHRNFVDNYRCLLPLQITFGYDFSVRHLSGRCGFSFEELVFRLLLHLDSLDMSLVEILCRILSNVLNVEVGAVEGITALVRCCSKTAT